MSASGAKKVLLVLTNHDKMGNLDKKTGWYLPEVAHPYHVFIKAGLDITFVSPKGGSTPMDPGSKEQYKDDPICKEFLEKDMSKTQDTKSINDVNAKDFKVIFFAGGHGPMFDLPGCDEANKAAAAIYENGGVVAAVCHGPAGIVNVKLSNGHWLVGGKKVTGFTNSEEGAIGLCEQMPFLLEDLLKEHGATFEPADADWNPCVHTSERLVTGQNPNSATPCAEAVVKLLQ